MASLMHRVSPSPVEPVDRRYFDQLYATNDDPWSLSTGWYETRKRALMMAVLTRPRYHRIFEPGCAAGELSALLAMQCDELVAMDLHPRAAMAARRRLAGHANATVSVGTLPDDWPSGKFDLIVLSELGYYFDEASWARCAELAIESLRPDGAIVACHWNAPFDARRQRTAEVHSVFDGDGRLHLQVKHREPDFTLQVWTLMPESLATLEHLS
jgi:SAM-dependent methyltransferase